MSRERPDVEPSTAAPTGDAAGPGLEADGGEESVDIEAVLEQLDRLEQTVDDPNERQEVQETRSMVTGLDSGGSSLFGNRISRYTTRDVAETFVGGVLLSLPLLVEDGVYDIADHFAAVTPGGIPIFFVANVLFIVTMAAMLLYWTDIQRVENHNPIFGIVPRRLVGVLVISFVVAAGLMTLWGRVEGWSEPDIAIYRISVIWAAAAFGGALGDILPGVSSGTEMSTVLERE